MLSLVSIVTVTKNLIDAGRLNWFHQCIESVRTQDYANIEHLIIDSASSDGSLKLFQELGLTYVSEPDGGIYNAFNKGIRLAKGKYITFLNPDNVYTCSDAVSLSVDALKENTADFCYTPYNFVFSNSSVIETTQPNWETRFTAQPIGHPTIFTSSQLLKELNCFGKDFRKAEDFDLIMRSLLHGEKQVCIDKVIVYFRNTGISGLGKNIPIQENSRVMETNGQNSHAQAFSDQENKFLVLLSKLVDFPSKYSLLLNNLKNFLKFVRRWFIIAPAQRKTLLLFSWNYFFITRKK